MYVMMEILWDLWLWVVWGVVLVIFEGMKWGVGMMVGVVGFVWVVGIYLFMKG